MFATFLRSVEKLLNGRRRHVRRQHARSLRKARPAVEALEDRRVRSAMTLDIAMGLTQRLNIATGLTHSAENYRNIVTDDYQHYLNRAPDVEGLNFWVGQMRNDGLTDEQLEAGLVQSPEYIASHGGFFGSPEYVVNHGGSPTDWLRGLYHDLLGREPDDFGLIYWTMNLGDPLSPQDIALRFATSAERETQHVTANYEKYLGRAPDPEGLAFWVDQFVKHGQTNENLVAGFVGSDEYFTTEADSNQTLLLGSAINQLFNRTPQPSDYVRWLNQPADVNYRELSATSSTLFVDNPIWTSNGELTSNGGFAVPRDHGTHAGIDIAADEGTLVHAVADGVVVLSRSNWTKGDYSDGIAAYNAGNDVVIEHKDPITGEIYYTKYMHLNRYDQPKLGDWVSAGQIIGRVGRTGNVPPTDATHLHFEIRRDKVNGDRVVPMIGPGAWVGKPGQIAGTYSGTFTSTATNGTITITITGTHPSPNGNTALQAIDGTIALDFEGGQSISGSLRAFVATDAGDLFGGLDSSFQFASGAKLTGDTVSGDFVFQVSATFNGHGTLTATRR